MRTDRRRDSLSLYEKLRYISKGVGSKCYIDTGLIMNENIEIELLSDYLQDGPSFIGNSNNFWMFYAQNTRIWQFWLNGTWAALNKATLRDGKYNIIIRSGQIEDLYTGQKRGNVYKLNGVAKIWLYNEGQIWSGNTNIYFCNIKENGKYIMKLIPVKRKSDGMIGMYDKVGGKFYTSPNGAKFSGGVSRRISLLPLFTSAMAERRAA